MGLITTLRSSPMSIVWSSLNMGDWLQHLKENHPSITCDGASHTNPEFGDGAERSATILATPRLPRRLTHQKIQGSLCLLADHTGDDVIREKR
jgi:hypothetical protein